MTAVTGEEYEPNEMGTRICEDRQNKECTTAHLKDQVPCFCALLDVAGIRGISCVVACITYSIRADHWVLRLHNICDNISIKNPSPLYIILPDVEGAHTSQNAGQKSAK